MMKIIACSAFLVMLTGLSGCVVAPAPGPGYYGARPAYYAAPVYYRGGAYYGHRGWY